jgi:hypothetical protein
MFRDTTLSAASKRREFTIFLSCFIGANVLNVIGIIQNQSPAKELITQLHVVLLVSLVLYGVVIFLRVLYYLVSRLWVRK